MASFFATLKKELVQGQNYGPLKETGLGLFEHVEAFYNRARLRSSLGYRSPEELESDEFS